jgi:DNA polymerase III subunit epsilon
MKRLIFIDMKTTGLHPEKGHKIYEIAAVEYIHGKPTGMQFHTYLNPEYEVNKCLICRELDYEVSIVNGLNWDKLKEEVLFKDIQSDLLDFFCKLDDERDYGIDFDKNEIIFYETDLVSHNAKFNMSFLNNEFKNCRGLRWNIPALCTKQLANKLFPGDPDNLDALSKRFDIDSAYRDIYGALINENTLINAKLLAKVYFKLREHENKLQVMGGVKS